MSATIASPHPRDRGPRASDAVICFEHVSKSFGSHQVLRDVSLDIAAGEAFGILGRSGMGKSVSLALMIRLLAPDRGRVFVEGKDLGAIGRDGLMDVRKRIGFLFQNAALLDSLSVYDNVAFPLRRHTRKPEREIQELVKRRLEDVGLGGDANKMPADLSGGMRKRVGLARALVLDPPIILVDEPSSGLDAITASEIYDLLRNLKETGKTLVVVTHDGSAMRGIVDELAVLDRASIVARGSPEELARNENEVVRALVAGSER